MWHISTITYLPMLHVQDILHYDTCLKTDDILFLFASPQLHVKEDELVNWKNELAVMDLEIQVHAVLF